jgi:hypothetical protein
MNFISSVVSDLDPKINPAEVAHAEKEFNDWFAENRSRKPAQRPLP